MSFHPLSSYSLRSAAWGERVIPILTAALEAVEPAAAVSRHMQREGDQLNITGKSYDLSRYRRVLVVGAGKAGAPMAAATANILGDRLTGGLVLVKTGYAGDAQATGPVAVLEAGHPIPDERGVAGTRRLFSLLQDCRADNLIICLISGGGSALLVSPVPGVSLSDLQGLTASLLACGATINEINTLRKHLDQAKGGGLARQVFPASLATLILSDVVGDPLDVIASGPGVPDTSTFEQAWLVLDRYNIRDQVAPAILSHLERGRRGELPDTPKPGDPLFAEVHNVIVGNNLQAAQAALLQAQAGGFNTLLLTTFLQGEARQAGPFLASILRQAATIGLPVPRPACIVAGGETTVTLRGDGLGGRNQELALSAVKALASLSNVGLITLATDGGDGPTDAAGALVTGETLARAHQAGLEPDAFLARNDSYHFFAALDDLLRPGPTRTNVNDLTFLFAF
jgi:glycerate 2-kinase